MPLTMARPGEAILIRKISGKDKTKSFLESLGFVAGERVTLVSEMAGNVIINVKNTRVALDRAMASRIII